MPCSWKPANISPVPKETPLSSLYQLRPISVTDIVIRLFEEIIIYVAKVIRSYLLPDQFSYRDGTNTSHALIKSQHMWLKWLDTGEADCVRVLPLISLRLSTQ